MCHTIYSPYICTIILILHLCSKFLRNRTIIHGDIAFNRFGGHKSVINGCSLGVNLVIDTFFCSFRYFTSISNLKTIEPLLMEIFNLEDLGDTECRLAVNSVVLVLTRVSTLIQNLKEIG